jgi:hypothetical protein
MITAPTCVCAGSEKTLRLSLTLFMLGIIANDHNSSFSLDYFAFFANRFY